MSFDFAGTHVIADIYDIDPAVVVDEQLILTGLTMGITRSGATLCGMQTKRFEPSGMTAIYLLSESHVSVHTYPDQRSLFFDAFTCGDHVMPETILQELVTALGRCQYRTETVGRGDKDLKPPRRLHTVQYPAGQHPGQDPWPYLAPASNA
jgi:S-adenosylmethionine decarboxylase